MNNKVEEILEAWAEEPTPAEELAKILLGGDNHGDDK